jgi:hypothetical protein
MQNREHEINYKYLGHKVYNNYFEGINPGSSNLRGAIVLMNGEVNPPGDILTLDTCWFSAN